MSADAAGRAGASHLPVAPTPSNGGFSYRRLNRLRGLAQLLALAFLVAVPVLNRAGVHWIVGTLYSISIGELDIADPAMTLQTVLLTKDVFPRLLLAAAVPAVLALVLGRVFCSWLCPYNTLLEWVDRFERRFLKQRWTRKHRRPIEANPHPFAYWAILAGLLLAAVTFGVPLLSWLSAPGIVSSQIAQAVLGMGPGLELGIVAVLLVAEVALARRFWCKYACPVGATFSLFRTRRTLRIACDASRCTCGSGSEACAVACPLGLLPRAGDVYPHCFNCGSCLAACEKMRRGALRFRFAADDGRVPECRGAGTAAPAADEDRPTVPATA
jgi:ferredoxin-type protein NapH